MNVCEVEKQPSVSSFDPKKLGANDADSVKSFELPSKSSVSQTNRMSTWRKFMQEAPVHKPFTCYERHIREVQKRVQMDEINRSLEQLNDEINAFPNPNWSLELLELKKLITKPMLYESRRTIHFLLGNIEEALADEKVLLSTHIEHDQSCPRSLMTNPFVPGYDSFTTILNDPRDVLERHGVANLVFGQKEQGFASLNKASASGHIGSLLLLLALEKPLPVPSSSFSISPIPLKTMEEVEALYDRFLTGLESTPADREKFLTDRLEMFNQNVISQNAFAHFLEQFQRQEYEAVIAETELFLNTHGLGAIDQEFFRHLKAAAKAMLHRTDEALTDYEDLSRSGRWSIEKTLLKIIAGDREGAKADLEQLVATSFCSQGPVWIVSVDEFLRYKRGLNRELERKIAADPDRRTPEVIYLSSWGNSSLLNSSHMEAMLLLRLFFYTEIT